jgi:oxalate decarboxylase/phosphoglucose isomerase-like protein (cupin superfamily)
LVRKYKDMKDSYKGALKKGNPVIYKVYIKDYGDYEEGLTCINAGTVEGEFFMTKGHRHVKSRPEIYIPISGSGKLLISLNGRETAYDLKKNVFYHVPANSGHRLINTGKKTLKVITIYGKNAGHDYKFSFKRRVMR